MVMSDVVLIAEMVVTILVMIFVCFFTSGIAIIPGSIFEKKSTRSRGQRKRLKKEELLAEQKSRRYNTTSTS